MKNIYFIYDDETKVIKHASWDEEDVDKIFEGYSLDEQVFEFQQAHYWVGDEITCLKPFLDSLRIENLVTAFKPLSQHRFKLHFCEQDVLNEIVIASGHELNCKELVVFDTISGQRMYGRTPSTHLLKKFESTYYVEDAFNLGVFKEVFLITTDEHAARHYCKSRSESLTVMPMAIQINDLHLVVSGSPTIEVEPDEPETDKLSIAISLLENINECPYYADEVTRANFFDADNEEHRKALIVNFSCSYEKLHLIQEFLKNI